MARTYRKLPELTEQDIQRFWGKVQITGPNECWPWTARCLPRGYGQFSVKGTSYFASRICYYIIYHRDPSNENVCHSCDNPPCCNPRHLWKGTQKDNIADCIRKGRKHDPPRPHPDLGERILHRYPKITALQ